MSSLHTCRQWLISFKNQASGVFRAVWVLVAIFVFGLASIPTAVFADGCADDMSQDDCKALMQNWPNWILDETDGSEASSCDTAIGSVPAGDLPSTVPEPYNGLITAASAKFGSSAALEAAILYWENRGFPPPDKQWATSSAGAKGPMQFLQSTFDAYAVDGNGDGKKQILNVADAIYSAANLLAKNGAKTNTPLGNTSKPLAPNTLLRVAASYNWGGGNVQNAGENATLGDLPKETSDYLKAVYILISSNFSEKPASGGELEPSTGGGDDATSTADCSSTDTGNFGQGSGKFTDNTSVSISGLSAALARARQYASWSNAKLDATICSGGELTGCYRQCDRLAANIWGHATSGSYTALGHWRAAVRKGTAHPGDRKVPIGALVFYDTGGAGHVAVYLGDNKVISNDAVTKGGVDVVDASKIEPWGPYLGWVNPIPWAQEV